MQLQTKKLRIRVSSRGWVAAHFPGEEMDGKLFHAEDPSRAVRDVAEIMYRRRLNKQIRRPL